MRQRLSVVFAALMLPALASCSSSTAAECVPIGGKFHAQTPTLVLLYHSNVDVAAITDTLEARYDFTAVSENPAGHFATIPAPQPDAALNGLRCEPSIQAMWYNQPGE